MRPSRYLEHISGLIKEHFPESELPDEYRVEFKLTSQAIQFNMLADDQVGLLVEIAKEWVNKIQDMAGITFIGRIPDFSPTL